MDEPSSSSDQRLTQDTMAPEPIQSEPRAPWADAVSMAEAGLLTDVGIVFDLAWIYVPILGAAFIPLIPTPFAILYLRRGARITIFAACVAGFLMTVLVGPHYGWRMTLEAAIGLAIGWAMRRHWPPWLAILLGLFVNATVAYVAAFAGVYALGLPLHDLYVELRNLLVSLGWLLDTTAALVGAQHAWLGVRPVFAMVAHVSLAYWIPMFYLYVVALSLPTVVLYYSVASTTAYALGLDVLPFPPPWLWRMLRIVGLMLTPFIWLARLLWRVVTVPLWGPVWLARAVGRWRRTRRLRHERAALDAHSAAESLPESAHRVNGVGQAALDTPLMEAATPGKETQKL